MKPTEREHISGHLGIFLPQKELDMKETYKKIANIWIFYSLKIKWAGMKPTEREHIYGYLSSSK